MTSGQPQRGDFATNGEYEQAWYVWRALWRDDRMSDDELKAQFEALCDVLGSTRGAR